MIIAIIIILAVLLSFSISEMAVYGPIKGDKYLYNDLVNLELKEFEYNDFDKRIMYFGGVSKGLVVAKSFFPNPFSKFHIQRDGTGKIGKFRIYRFSKSNDLLNKYYDNRKQWKC